ncbi:MAG: MBOAT family O-acyltransferase [Flavobacteriales bacterium]
MLFNSLEFALFLPLVFLAYWAIPAARLRARNLLLLVASYVFYGWWDWRFLGLIALSSLVDYSAALAMVRRPRQRHLWLGISMALNLGMLGYFKYAGFFLDSLAGAFTFLGMPMEAPALHIVLPVGISFYTFQTMSYTIDVYRGRLQPTRDLAAFLAFVSFFPQLVAGPIERATNLLPQFATAHRFDASDARDALRQMLWGLFKKVAIADTCATLVNEVFAGHTHHSAPTLVLAAVLFAFQIYGDFSGYSDIAIGTARLFGFRLMNNFATPYFSRDIAEFWRRWHISLSTWFRDYVYIPLGGSRSTMGRNIFNVMVVFLVSGLWHGANWTFVVWGALNALFFLPLMLGGGNRANTGSVAAGALLPSPRTALAILFTFAQTTVAWVFFRASDLPQAFSYLGGIVRQPWLTGLSVPTDGRWLLIPLLLALEWVHRDRPHTLAIGHWPLPLRWATYLALLATTLLLFESQASFIYFQF